MQRNPPSLALSESPARRHLREQIGGVTAINRRVCMSKILRSTEVCRCCAFEPESFSFAAFSR